MAGLKSYSGSCHCGVESYAEGTAPDGTATVGINLRCIEAIDVDKLSLRPWDGRSK